MGCQLFQKPQLIKDDAIGMVYGSLLLQAAMAQP